MATSRSAISSASSFKRAERDGKFVVDDVSPLRAAAAIDVPALIIHFALDTETRPAHSERVFAALRGPKQILLVRDAGHNDAMKAPSGRRSSAGSTGCNSAIVRA
jgi:fermentation-respiration switch protein FrsA (DUF1100 family)